MILRGAASAVLTEFPTAFNKGQAVATIHLHPAEALVLIDFLIRFRDAGELRIDHPAEQHVLWDLCALLESQVPELVAPGYRAELAAARDLVASDEWE